MSNINSEVYTVKDVQNILGVCRNTAYELFRDPPFAVIKLGKTYRVSKVVFDRWLHQQ